MAERSEKDYIGAVRQALLTVSGLMRADVGDDVDPAALTRTLNRASGDAHALAIARGVDIWPQLVIDTDDIPGFTAWLEGAVASHAAHTDAVAGNAEAELVLALAWAVEIMAASLVMGDNDTGAEQWANAYEIIEGMARKAGFLPMEIDAVDKATWAAARMHGLAT